MKYLVFLFIVLFYACQSSVNTNNKVIVSGKAGEEVSYLTIGEDTISVIDGLFNDTIIREKDQYDYLKLDSWKWAKVVYLRLGETSYLEFKNDTVITDYILNDYLLNLDHLLVPYTAKWDANTSDFTQTWHSEFSKNMKIIDDYFDGSGIPNSIIKELKDMEYMKRGHRTANFISFQERKDNIIDRSIYKFVDSVDLSNPRLAFHVNNRNFQYYYYMDKVSDEVDDSEYPFAIIDTAKKHVTIPAYKEMIITAAIKNGFYDEAVDHDKLFQIYEEEIGEISKQDEIVSLYNRIQSLKPGNKAPDIGDLMSLSGETKSLRDFSNQNLLVTVWGTWCPYCKEELPYLKELIGKYEGKLHSIAISIDKDTAKWKNYLNENVWKGTHLLDPNRRSLFRENYMISGTNVYYLIDKNGIIRSSGLKPSNSQLDALISAL